MDGLSKLFYA